MRSGAKHKHSKRFAIRSFLHIHIHPSTLHHTTYTTYTYSHQQKGAKASTCYLYIHLPQKHTLRPRNVYYTQPTYHVPPLEFLPPPFTNTSSSPPSSPSSSSSTSLSSSSSSSFHIIISVFYPSSKLRRHPSFHIFFFFLFLNALSPHIIMQHL